MDALEAGATALAAPRHHVSDRDLVMRIRSAAAAEDPDRAREVFGEMVVRHQRRASRLAYHYLRDAADADEAVQDAFVKAYVRLHTFREDLPFEAWLTRIVWWGLAPGTTGGERPVDEPRATSPSPEQQLLAKERRDRVATALETLPERQRTVFVLTHYEGYTPREVSRLAGVSESTVRVHLFRAVRKLRVLLAGEWEAKRTLVSRARASIGR